MPSPGFPIVIIPPPETYEDTQPRPGDKEAQTSQRPVAVHALENLATSDMGIVKFRLLLRKAAKSIQKGEDPPGIAQSGNSVISVASKNEILPPE
jgi:hypothetical protein